MKIISKNKKIIKDTTNKLARTANRELQDIAQKTTQNVTEKITEQAIEKVQLKISRTQMDCGQGTACCITKWFRNICCLYPTVDDIYQIDESRVWNEFIRHLQNGTLSGNTMMQIIQESAKNDVEFFIVMPDNINAGLTAVVNTVMQTVFLTVKPEDIKFITMQDVHNRDVIEGNHTPVFVFVYVPRDKINAIETVCKDIFICHNEPNSTDPDGCRVIADIGDTIIYYRE